MARVGSYQVYWWQLRGSPPPTNLRKAACLTSARTSCTLQNQAGWSHLADDRDGLTGPLHHDRVVRHCARLPHGPVAGYREVNGASTALTFPFRSGTYSPSMTPPPPKNFIRLVEVSSSSREASASIMRLMLSVTC